MKNLYILGLVILIPIAFLIWGPRPEPGQISYAFWEDTNVACLPNGHQMVAFHIHPTLQIFVDGVEELVPANIGVTAACMAEIHTHDGTGELHIETITADRIEQIRFADFFPVWGTEVDREGYDLEITVDGSVVESVDDIPLVDGAKVVLSYTSVDDTSAPTAE